MLEFKLNLVQFKSHIRSCPRIGLIGVELGGQVIVQKCFKEKRLLANGIAASGTGFGMLAMGPVIHVLLSNYGLRGTFLILSGICLNGIVFGLLIPNNEELPKTELEKSNKTSPMGTKNSVTYDSTVLNEFPSSVHTQPKGTTTSAVVNEDTASEKSSLIYNETNGYLRLLKNIYFVMYSTGSVLHFTAMKATISKSPFSLNLRIY